MQSYFPSDSDLKILPVDCTESRRKGTTATEISLHPSGETALLVGFPDPGDCVLLWRTVGIPEGLGKNERKICTRT
ncbi:hypothetical protein [Scytonema sp. HK-05]|uniref:hypothetical protein n=1 Tax=Scytonema sp. HK-05 TaxID=1137095 RepID=UPI001160E5C4|nr:hypothetical protein [Scytonema sp. HK-05]